MGMSFHYLLASHISRKHSENNVDIVVNMVIKQVIVVKEKANLENKKVGQRKFKPYQNRKPIWKQGKQKEKYHFDISKVKCFNCNPYGHFARDRPTKKIKQI